MCRDLPVEHHDKDAGDAVTAVDADRLRIAFIRNYGGIPELGGRAAQAGLGHALQGRRLHN